jgi:hypothetical protein
MQHAADENHQHEADAEYPSRDRAAKVLAAEHCVFIEVPL